MKRFVSLLKSVPRIQMRPWLRPRGKPALIASGVAAAALLLSAGWVVGRRAAVPAQPVAHVPAQPAEPGASAHAEAARDDAAHGERTASQRVARWLSGVQGRVRELREADQENQRLRVENANLRLQLESFQFDCRAVQAARATREQEIRLDRETGSKMGRNLASIAYKLPSHLLPQQLHALGLSYLKAHEDEKAAVIFTFLTGMEDDQSYRTVKNLLLAGIAWYRIDNFRSADHYFDAALQHKDIAEQAVLQRQARLWKALAAEKLGEHGKSQAWLREVLDLAPHSMEAKWINSREVDRAVAAED